LRSQSKKQTESTASEEDREQFPFSPSISEFARALPTAGTVEERLEALAAERQRKLEQLQQLHLAKEDRELTFRPAINRCVVDVAAPMC